MCFCVSLVARLTDRTVPAVQVLNFPSAQFVSSSCNAKPVCHPGLSDSTRVGTSFFVFLELHFCSSTAIAELVSGELLGATGLDQV